MRLSLLASGLLAAGIASAATPVDGMYTRLFGGYTYLPDNVSTTVNSAVWNRPSYNGGYNVGGAFGFASNPLRYELEYTFVSADTSSFNLNYVGQTGVSGTSSGNFVMANIFYDCPEVLPSVAPYLGVGLGYANIQSTLQSTGPNGYTYFKGTDNEFAYQATLGLTYNFAENYALNVNYRYIATDNASHLGKVFQANLASAGAIYRFDNGTYK